MATNPVAEAIRLATIGEAPHISDEAYEAILACGGPGPMAELATAQRVAPWIAAALASDPRTVDLPGVEQLRAAGAGQSFGALRLFAELTRVLTELNAAAVPVVVMKGPVLGDTLYPDAGLRPYGDIDILIHERDLRAVSALLIRMGYHERYGDDEGETHRFHECHGVFQRNFLNNDTGHTVEVHCDHLQIGLEPVSMDEIWASAREHRFGRATARGLEDHDMFVHLCVHLQRHGYERLIWLKDIDLMVRKGELDWATIERKAAEQGCLGAVSYALALLPAMLETPLPAGALALSRRQGLLSRWMFKRTWPVSRIRNLEPQRQWRLRRLSQFAPETGFVRGGLPAFLMSGRRKDKARVLLAGMRRQLRPGTNPK